MVVVGQASAAATSVAIPAHQPGDLILVMARGTAAAPVKPTAGGTVPAWGNIQSLFANACGLTSVGFVATASNHTTGVFTSATHICVLVLRPDSGKRLMVGASFTGNGNNTQTIIYPAVALQVVDGSSWGVRCGTRTVAATAVGTAPTNWTNQIIQPAGASALMSVHTRAGLTGHPVADTVTTTGTNAAYRAHTIEVREQLLAQTQAPSGITSPQTFGAITTRRYFGAGGVAPAAAFGTLQFRLALGVAGLSSAQAFGGIPGSGTPVPGVPPPTYDTHIVGEYLVGQALVGWTGGNQFGTPFLKNLDFVGVGGVLSAQSFGAVTIRAVIRPAPLGVPSAQSFGKVSLRFVLAGVPSAQSFGAPFFIAVQGLVVPPGVPSAQSFGLPRFRLIALVAGVASAQAFGTVRSRLYAQATGVTSAQAFGTPGFKLRFGGTGVVSAQAFGTPSFAFRKAVLGVGSAQSFGVPKALFLVRPTGLSSAQTFGQIVIRTGPVWVVVTGLGSAQAFGTVDAYNAFLYPVSCLGVDLVGVPDYAEVLTAVADTSVALTNGVEQAVDLDAVTCVSVALDPVEITR